MVPSGGLDEHSAEAKRPPSTFSSIGTTEIAVFPSPAQKATSIIFSTHTAVFSHFIPIRGNTRPWLTPLPRESFCVSRISHWVLFAQAMTGVARVKNARGAVST